MEPATVAAQCGLSINTCYFIRKVANLKYKHEMRYGLTQALLRKEI
jgi:hypothetical protein